MSGEKKLTLWSGICSCWVFVFCSSCWAADIDLKDAVAGSGVSIDSSTTAPQVGVAPRSSTVSASLVRIDQNISRDTFTKAGYLVASPSQVPSVGSIVRLSDADDLFHSGSGKKVFFKLSSDSVKTQPGDQVMIYRVSDFIQEPRTGFTENWVRILNFAKVIEVQKDYCQIELEGPDYGNIQAGDQVKFLDDENDRWIYAHKKKNLPDKFLKCYVMGGDPSKMFYSQGDVIFLTIGRNKGVVEGQKFELRDEQADVDSGDSVHILDGRAEVIYAGQDSSTAIILNSNKGIQAGFEAISRP